MSGNTFGNLFQLTSFGESHGPAIGGVIDGCPSGIELDIEAIQRDLNRRKPGQSAIVTQRKEPDEVEFFSGIFEGKTTGVPIGFAISIPIKNREITITSKTNTVLLMPIRFTTTNTASGTIVVGEEARPEKRPVG